MNGPEEMQYLHELFLGIQYVSTLFVSPDNLLSKKRLDEMDSVEF